MQVGWPLPPVGGDPGHGGANSGARIKRRDGRWVREADINLRIMRIARNMLPQLYLSREDDIAISQHERARLLRRKGVEAIVSGHCDSLPSAPGVHGTHAYYRKGDKVGLMLARFAVANAPDALRLKRGGVICAHDNPHSREDDWLKNAERIVTVHAPTPVVLIEFGYMTNAGDLRYLCSADGVEACARLVADTLEYYRHMIYGVAL